MTTDRTHLLPDDIALVARIGFVATATRIDNEIKRLEKKGEGREFSHGERLGNGMMVVKVQSEEWLQHVNADLYDRAVPFWQTYAFGSKVHPSCFGCGFTGDMSTRHLDLPNIFLCGKCVEAIRNYETPK